jgi:hypothetical protein
MEMVNISFYVTWIPELLVNNKLERPRKEAAVV